MIPLRDEQETASCAVATCSIIFITSLVFVWQMITGINDQAVAYTFGFVPAKYTMAQMAAYFSLLNKLSSPFTYMFLHGGFWHFIGNMWFLYIFGDNIEQEIGPFRFIAFYLVCGLLAAFFHFLLNHSSAVPTIGASGSIAGVMGAYFLLHPGNKILTLIIRVSGDKLKGLGNSGRVVFMSARLSALLLSLLYYYNKVSQKYQSGCPVGPESVGPDTFAEKTAVPGFV